MENEPIINNNKYKKLVLNTSSELKFTKIKSTFLCSEAKKISKENISKYFYLGNKINNNNNEIYTLKVIYHDKTFENEIKYLSSYNEFYSILTPLKEFSHISKLKTALYNDENVIFDSDFEEGNLRMAIEINKNKEYDLIMRPEYNSKKLYTNFFFSLMY